MQHQKPKMYGRRYPWDQWLVPGKSIVLTRGEDYNGRAYTMAQQIRNRLSSSRYRHLSASITVLSEERILVSILRRGV
jgi:hypothetical protein